MELSKDNDRVRLEVVRKLLRYVPVVKKEQNGTDTSLTVSYKGRADEGEFYHYPLILDPDGSLWREANRYLLSKLNGVLDPNHRTLESIAQDLAYFRQWQLDEDIDFLATPKRPRARPTYRFCTHLHDEIRFQTIKPSTAKRRMSSIQGFYRWLEKEGCKFEFPLWQESEASISFSDAKGLTHQKPVVSTDLTRSFRISKQTSEFSEHINDGGKLRPLTLDEQTAIVRSLKKIANTEMSLSFLLALTTGARLQTIFTLRLGDFQGIPRSQSTAVRVKVGNGTLVSTKFGKQMVLLIPVWLYQRIQVYLRSERYEKRLERSKHVYPCRDQQYAFLTRAGQPYYMAANDPFTSLFRSPPRGNAVTQFIKQQLKPELLMAGHDFEFRFHDLRATFGMNILESQLQSFEISGAVDQKKPEFLQVLMYVRERMGHTRLSTTEAYLNYRQKYDLACQAQSDYEVYLQQVMSNEGD